MAELVSEVARLADRLHEIDYYEALAVERSCDYVRVRDAFYERAQRFHPDRFVSIGAEAVKRAVYAVYKRMTEAYNVLADPELRRAYDRQLAAGAKRLSDEARARRLSPEERQVASVFARVYLRSARGKLARGDLDGAWIDVELGLSIEDAVPLRALHTEVLRRMARPR